MWAIPMNTNTLKSGGAKLCFSTPSQHFLSGKNKKKLNFQRGSKYIYIVPLNKDARVCLENAIFFV